MNLDQLTDAVLKKLGENKPRALLIGKLPEINHNYNYVNEKPYDVIVLGQLPAAELLHMPNGAVCDALLENVPVYLWQHQPWRACKCARPLCRELAAAEQHLLRLGVIPMEQAGGLLTAEAARQLLKTGGKPAFNCRMTPLAKDILEGKSP